METLDKKPRVKSLGSLSGKRIWIDKITTAIFFLGDVDIQVDEDAKLILEIKIDSDTDDAKVDFKLEAEFDDENTGHEGTGGLRRRITVNAGDLDEDGENVLDLLTVRLNDVGLHLVADEEKGKAVMEDTVDETGGRLADDDADDAADEHDEDEDHDGYEDEDDDKDEDDEDDDDESDDEEKDEHDATDSPKRTEKPTAWIVSPPSNTSSRLDTSGLPGWLSGLLSDAESVEVVRGIAGSTIGETKEQVEKVDFDKSLENTSTGELKSRGPAWVFPYGDGISYTVRREL